MEEDEEIKKKINKDKNYEEFSIEDLLEEIKNLKKELKFLVIGQLSHNYMCRENLLAVLILFMICGETENLIKFLEK